MLSGGHLLPNHGDGKESCSNPERGKYTNPREYLYLAYGNSLRGITNVRLKYIEYGTGPVQLSDLANDPLETINLIHEPTHKESKATLADTLRRQVLATGEASHVLGRNTPS